MRLYALSILRGIVPKPWQVVAPIRRQGSSIREAIETVSEMIYHIKDSADCTSKDLVYLAT